MANTENMILRAIKVLHNSRHLTKLQYLTPFTRKPGGKRKPTTTWLARERSGVQVVEMYFPTFALGGVDDNKERPQSSYLVSQYVVGSKCLRPDIQKPRQMENAVTDIHSAIYSEVNLLATDFFFLQILAHPVFKM